MPESQTSSVEEFVSLKENSAPQKELAEPPKSIKNSTQGDRTNSQLEVSVASNRHSEKIKKKSDHCYI